MISPMIPVIAIVGCGRVGSAIARFLSKAGYRLSGLASKRLSSAKRLAYLTGTGRFTEIPWEITKEADIVFLTTPDSAISDTCSSIAFNYGFKKDSVVLHCSGVLPSTILSSAKSCGAFIGSMHPMQSFALNEENGSPFHGIIFAVEGDIQALHMAAQITVDLGADYIPIKTEDKTLYHAAAVVASNYLVTLLSLAFRLVEHAGISGSDTWKVLKPLINGTLSNIEKAGIPAALTGPVVRGDIETVKRHIEAIGEKTPELLDLYNTLGFYTIGIAESKGTLSEESADILKKITKG
ncbi:MAG: DUF2520 domain-containing protein [Deltaproteobacteria bacterium]|nr:DUF2520 domain-containing protein [Deltaproteobacteria bacterium]